MVLVQTNLPLPLFRRGKVRDSYELGDRLLIVCTDRISAFDFVLPTPIPGKGRVLNQLSAFWFDLTRHIIPNHLIFAVHRKEDLVGILDKPDEDLVGRSMVVRRVEAFPVEVIVRGYLFGSAWKEYLEVGRVGGIDLPPDLKLGERLPEPIITPTTKSYRGHDLPLTRGGFEELVGGQIADKIRKAAVEVYLLALKHALSRGIIIADTKMEFGLIDGELYLIDELLTPDSSRFWDGESYRPGFPPKSFDKQIVRDWLLSSGWDVKSPPPPIPQHIVQLTSQKYQEIYSRLVL